MAGGHSVGAGFGFGSGDGCGCGLATWHGAIEGRGRCVASAAPVGKEWGVMVEIERAI